MKSVTVDLAVETVSFLLLMQLSSCDRYVLRPLIRSAINGPDVLMVMSSAYLISLMFGGGVETSYK